MHAFGASGVRSAGSGVFGGDTCGDAATAAARVSVRLAVRVAVHVESFSCHW
jgi:hypothetical protein